MERRGIDLAQARFVPESRTFASTPWCVQAAAALTKSAAGHGANPTERLAHLAGARAADHRTQCPLTTNTGLPLPSRAAVQVGPALEEGRSPAEPLMEWSRP